MMLFIRKALAEKMPCTISRNVEGIMTKLKIFNRLLAGLIALNTLSLINHIVVMCR